MTGHFALCGEGLCIGYDSGDAVSARVRPGFEFTGGKIVKVVFDVADDAYVDVEPTSRRRWRATETAPGRAGRPAPSSSR